MIDISIPGRFNLKIENVIFDMNGTLTTDGLLKKTTKNLLKKLSNILNIYIITADTFGKAKKTFKGLNINLTILEKQSNAQQQKLDILKKIGINNSITIGNGYNDVLMLKEAILSIAILGEEGLNIEALKYADILVKDIDDALNLLLYPKRIIATLRN